MPVQNRVSNKHGIAWDRKLHGPTFLDLSPRCLLQNMSKKKLREEGWSTPPPPEASSDRPLQKIGPWSICLQSPPFIPLEPMIYLNVLLPSSAFFFYSPCKCHVRIYGVCLLPRHLEKKTREEAFTPRSKEQACKLSLHALLFFL
jgi:hypothetical protein